MAGLTRPWKRQRILAAQALVLAALAAGPVARADDIPAHLAVTLLETDGPSIRLRLRIRAGLEPAIELSNGPTPGDGRLVMTWPGAVALERPLPDPPGRGDGALRALTLHADGDASRLELALGQPVRAQLRRVADSWVLRLDPEAPAAGSGPLPATSIVPIATAAPLVAPPPLPAGAAPEQLLADVSVNGRPLSDVVGAELWPGRGLLLPVAAWTEARLKPPAQAAALSDGTPAYELATIPGAAYVLDRQALTLKITVPPGAFAASTIAAQLAPVLPPPRPQPGAVLNYDLSATSVDGAGASGGAFLEGIAFGPAGNLVNSVLLRSDGTSPHAQRLDTFWRYDMPGRMQTLVLGDTIGTGGAWSRPVRYAGLRWGRDFGMRPGFVTLPQQSLAGEAALPSTVEVLVNNARRLSQQVPPGPFELSNVPIVTGAGELNLVVRDLLGHETVVRQSYYASPRLLAPGLTDFSFEGGRLRYGYGLDDHYGDGFAAATLRAGLTRFLTGEARVEVQPGRRAAGFELASLLGSVAVGRVALARSQGSSYTAADGGQLVQAGIEHSTPRGGAALEYEHASEGFAPFGELPGPAAAGLRPRARLSASAGGALVGKLSGGASYVRQSRWNGERIALAGLSLSAPVAQRASINLSLSKRVDGEHDWRAAINLSVPLDDGVHLDGRVDRDSSGEQVARLSATRPAPAGPGLGWHVEASTQERQRARAAFQYNTNSAEWSTDLASDAHGALAARAGMRGSLGILGGLPFASRPIGQGSFAVVEVEGMPDIPIKRSHQVVASTNGRGLAFVPGLLPWQQNLLEIDPEDLPLDVAIGAAVQEVTPYAGSGMKVSFSVKRTRQALLVLRQADGKPVPLGARVHVLPAGPDYSAGLRGEIWLGELPAGAVRLEVSWPAGGCTLDLPAQPGTGAPERIGPLACAKEAK